MMQVQGLDFSPKNRVIWIGGLHGVAMLYALFYSIANIIDEERPLTDGDVAFILLHIALHAFLISTLIMGALAGNSLFLIPWLVVTFPVFAAISYFTLQYTTMNYVAQALFNFVFIGFGWFLWFTVLFFFRSCKSDASRWGKT